MHLTRFVHGAGHEGRDGAPRRDRESGADHRQEHRAHERAEERAPLAAKRAVRVAPHVARQGPSLAATPLRRRRHAVDDETHQARGRHEQDAPHGEELPGVTLELQAQVDRLVSKAKADNKKAVLLLVNRGGNEVFMAVKVG